MRTHTHAAPSSSSTNDLKQRQQGQSHALPAPRSGHALRDISVLPPAPMRPQAKLTIGRPGDAYEVEADRVADRVMAMPPHAGGAVSTEHAQAPTLQRACAGCEEEDERVSAKEVPGATPAASPAFEAALPAVTSSAGQPLDPATRAFVEPRLLHDFSRVRIHTDAKAAASARSLQAQAYTMGNDIVFGEGRYAPNAPEGKHLLIHELVHVVQQNATGTPPARIQRQMVTSGGGEGEVTSTGHVDPVKRLTRAPEVDPSDVISLVDAEQIPEELKKSGARYVYLVAGDQDVYLELGDEPDRTAVLDKLTRGLFGQDGAVRSGIDPKTYFTLDGDDVVAGAAQETVSISMDTRPATDVLTDSNEESNIVGDAATDPLGEKMDQVWYIMNGGRSELRSTTTHKDPSWYNRIVLDEDLVTGEQTVRIVQSGRDRRKYPVPEMTIEEYRQMLIRDFDANGAITKFRDHGGQSAFVAAVLARFPAEDEGTMTVIATEVWSYATTGMDTKGVTNIAQMQGYLYALDPNIRVSSDTNTPMKNVFNAGTAEAPIMIQAGDGKHGRATILTTRHLLANVTFTLIEPERITTIKPDTFGGFDDRDRFIRDASPSMTAKWITIQKGIDKILKQGSFDPTGKTPGVQGKIDGEFGAVQIEIFGASRDNDNVSPSGHRWVKDFSRVLEDAYDKIYPEHDKDDALAFLALFQLTDADLADVFKKSFGRNDYALLGDELREKIGDVQAGNPDEDARGESSLKAIIATLLYDPQYTVDPLAPDERPRLNAVADEAEQSIEYLELAQKLSEVMGIEVRILATPTTPVGFVPETDLVIIDLKSMVRTPDVPTPVGAPERDGEYPVEYIELVAVIGGIERTVKVTVLKKGRELIDEQAGNQKHYQKTYVPLTPKQTGGGVSE